MSSYPLRQLTKATAHVLGEGHESKLEPKPEPEPSAKRPAQELASGSDSLTVELLQKTVAQFKRDPTIPRAHMVAQKKYAIFSRNRTVELYTTFFELAGGIPDCSRAKFKPSFTACVPFPGKKNERQVSGMVAGGRAQGLVRYEYKGNIIEECRTGGIEHGLRIVCTQMGDYWIRLYSNGKRLAQIVLSADCSISACPKPVDEGGLEALRSHLHLILGCLGAMAK